MKASSADFGSMESACLHENRIMMYNARDMFLILVISGLSI